MPLHRAVWLASALAVLHPGAVAAQRRARVATSPGLVVTARQDLSFGHLFRGTARAVLPTAHEAAQFEISAAANAQLQVTMVLPDALFSLAGEALPLVFGAGDGLAVRDGGAGHETIPFNPTSPLVTTIGGGDRLLITLGGTAVPTRTQSLGQYAATVTVVVADLGT